MRKKKNMLQRRRGKTMIKNWTEGVALYVMRIRSRAFLFKDGPGLD